MSFYLKVRLAEWIAGSSWILVWVFLVLVESSSAAGQEASDDLRANDHFRVYANLLLEKYDLNDDGFLNQTEMAEMSRPPSDKRFDLDGDGKLSFNEVVQAIKRPSAPQVEEKTQPQKPVPKIDEKFSKYADALIKTYDQNKDGFIDIQERQKMRRPWPASYDKNSDEKFSRKELVDALSSSQSSKDSSNSAESGEETAKREASLNWSFADINLKFLEASLRKNDKNSNGQLDPDEIAAADWSRPDWRQSDTNRDGILSRGEMKRRYEKMFVERLAEARAKQSEAGQESEAARQMMQLMSRQRSQSGSDARNSRHQKASPSGTNLSVHMELYLLRLPEQASASSVTGAMQTIKDDEKNNVVEKITEVANRLGIKQYDQFFFTATDREPTRITSGASIHVTIASVPTPRGRQSQIQNYDIGLAIDATPQVHSDGLTVDLEIKKSDVIQKDGDEDDAASIKVVNWEFQSNIQLPEDGLAVIGSSTGNQHWILVVKATQK